MFQPESWCQHLLMVSLGQVVSAAPQSASDAVSALNHFRFATPPKAAANFEFPAALKYTSSDRAYHGL
jgi:hypothetical protein